MSSYSNSSVVTLKTVSGRTVGLPLQEASYHNLIRAAMRDLKLEQEGLRLVFNGKPLDQASNKNVDQPHPNLVAAAKKEDGITVVAIGVRAEVRTPSTAKKKNTVTSATTTPTSFGALRSPAGGGSVSPMTLPVAPPPYTGNGPLKFPHAPDGLKGLARSVTEEHQSSTHRYQAMVNHATMIEIRKLTENGKNRKALKEILEQAHDCCPEFVDMVKTYPNSFVDAVNGIQDRGMTVQEMMEAFAVALSPEGPGDAGGPVGGGQEDALLNVVQQLFQPVTNGSATGTVSTPIEDFLLPHLPSGDGARGITSSSSGGRADSGGVVQVVINTQSEEKETLDSLETELAQAQQSRDGLSIASAYSRLAIFHHRCYTVNSDSWSEAEKMESHAKIVAAHQSAISTTIKLVEKRALEQLRGGGDGGEQPITTGIGLQQNEEEEEEGSNQNAATPVKEATPTNHNSATTPPAQSPGTFGEQTGTTIRSTAARVDAASQPPTLEDEFYADILASFVHGVFQPAITYFSHSFHSRSNQCLSLECLFQYSYCVSQVLSPQGTSTVLASITDENDTSTVISIETPDFSKQVDQLLAHSEASKTHIVIYSPVDVGGTTPSSTNAGGASSSASFMGTIGAWVITPCPIVSSIDYFAAAEATEPSSPTARLPKRIHFVARTNYILDQYNAAATTLFHPSFNAPDAWNAKAKEVHTHLVKPIEHLILPELSGADAEQSLHQVIVPGLDHTTNNNTTTGTTTTNTTVNSSEEATVPKATAVPIVHFVTPSVFEFSAFPLACLVEDNGAGDVPPTPLVAKVAVQQSLNLEALLRSATAAVAPIGSTGNGESSTGAGVSQEDIDSVSTVVAVQGAERPSWLSHNLKKMLNAQVQRDTEGANSPQKKKKTNRNTEGTETSSFSTILHTSTPGNIREEEQPAALLVSEEFHPSLLRAETCDAYSSILTRFAVQGNTVTAEQCYEVIRGFYVGLSYGLPLSIALRRGLLESQKQHPNEPWRWGRWILLMNDTSAERRSTAMSALYARCRQTRHNVHEVRKKEASRASVRGSTEFRYLSSHGVGPLFEQMLQHLLRGVEVQNQTTGFTETKKAESQEEVIDSLIGYLDANKTRLTNECLDAAAAAASNANNNNTSSSSTDDMSPPPGNTDQQFPSVTPRKRDDEGHHPHTEEDDQEK